MTIERPMFPPRADSVHAFPILRPPGDRPDETPPGDSPEPAAGLSRRHVLVGAAALPALGLLPAAVSTTTSAIDPIFAAIEQHRDLAKPYDAAWKARAKSKDFGEMTEQEKAEIRRLNDAIDDAHLPLETAALALVDTMPTTKDGIIAALFYMRLQHRNDGEHMIDGWLQDEDGEDDDRYIDWRDAWLETLTQAVLHLDGAAEVS